MKKSLALVILLAIGGIALADSPVVVKQKLSRIYANLAAMTAKKDVKGMIAEAKADMTPDFIYQNRGMKQNRDQMISTMKMQFQAIDKVISCTYKVDSIVVKGDEAVLNVSSRFIATMKAPDKKSHKMDGTSQSVDTWVKQGGAWKLKMIDCKKESATLDGKPVSMG